MIVNTPISRAKNQFDESIKDAEELLAHFNAARPAPGGLPPGNAEVLKRAGLILAITAWETYVEDRAHEAFEASLAAWRAVRSLSSCGTSSTMT